jgi:putative transport protein
VIISSLQSRLRFFGNTPNAARNILEDLGLVVFVAIVGINAGNSLLAQLTGALALKIFIVGFIACTIPPFIVWALGYHVFKINPAVLMGGVAGARSHSGPCREAAKEIKSTVPWIGFPVAYAVSGSCSRFLVTSRWCWRNRPGTTAGRRGRPELSQTTRGIE